MSKNPKALIQMSQCHSEADLIMCNIKTKAKTLPQIETFLGELVILQSKKGQQENLLWQVAKPFFSTI